MVEQVMKFITLLSDGKKRNIKELAKLIGKDQRTVYRYIKAMEKAGFIIDNRSGCPQVLEVNPRYVDPRHLLYFTVEEGAILSHLLLSIDSDNPLKNGLLSKLRTLLDASGLPILTDIDNANTKVRVIAEGMERHQQVLLKSYASGSSGTIMDRHVEPVQFSANYRQVYAYDVDKLAMRAFVISRMSDAQLLDEPWRHQTEHHVDDPDCFWISGNKWTSVTLAMSQLALHLLHEEYPLSQQYAVKKTKDPLFPYQVTLQVRNMKGVGRFVLGLGSQVRVVKGVALKRYVNNEREISLTQKSKTGRRKKTDK